MSKRTIALIVALFLVTILLLGIALNNSPKTGTKTANNTPTPTPYAQTSLLFSPSAITIPAGSSAQQTVNVMASTGVNDITGVQLEVSYDPKVLTNVSVATGPLFTNPLMFNNKIDTTNGTISYAYAITPSQQAKSGSGVVAVISFTPLRKPVDANGQPITQTMFKFLPKTVVTARGVDQSVLMPSSLSNGLAISFGAANTQTSLFTPSHPTAPVVQK